MDLFIPIFNSSTPNKMPKSYTVNELNEMSKKNREKKCSEYVHKWYKEIMSKVAIGQFEATLHVDENDCDNYDGTPHEYIDDASDEIEKLFPGISTKRTEGCMIWIDVSWKDEDLESAEE